MKRKLIGPFVLILSLASPSLSWSEGGTDAVKFVDIGSNAADAPSAGANHGRGLSIVSGAAPEEGTRSNGFVPLPKGDKLLLPLQLGITARVIDVATGANANPPKSPIFLIDQDGLPWMSVGRDRLIDLRTRAMIVVDKEFDDAAIFDNGQLVVGTDDSMGTLDDASPEEKKRNKFLMRFRPRLALPYKNMRLFTGENGTIYVVGKNPTDGKDELFLTVDDGNGDGEKKFVKLVAVKEGISAVTGDGRTTYLSTGPLIMKIGRRHKKLEFVAKLPGPIKELAYSEKAGLFYSNDQGVGFIGAKRPLEFLSAPGVSMRLRKDSLFILFVKEQEVLEFGGVSGFSKLLGKK